MTQICVMLWYSPYAPTQLVATQFLVYLSQTQQYRSVCNTMTGVKHFWRELSVLPDMSQWNIYHRVLKGIRRRHSGMSQKEHPIAPEELISMSRRFDDTPFAHVLLSCILCAWWGMLRKSNMTDDEVTCSPSSLFDVGRYYSRLVEVYAAGSCGFLQEQSV